MESQEWRQKALLPPLMTMLTAKQIRRACGSVCVCVSFQDRKLEREREKVQADVCVRSVGGSRLFTEDRETREGEERKGERERGLK